MPSKGNATVSLNLDPNEGFCQSHVETWPVGETVDANSTDFFVCCCQALCSRWGFVETPVLYVTWNLCLPMPPAICEVLVEARDLV